jgi:hypothetical protein
MVNPIKRRIGKKTNFPPFQLPKESFEDSNEEQVILENKCKAAVLCSL